MIFFEILLFATLYLPICCIIFRETDISLQLLPRLIYATTSLLFEEGDLPLPRFVIS